MKETLTIRKFKSEDKAQLIEIIQRNVPQYFAATEIEDYENYLSQKIQDYFVVLTEGTIIAAGGINYDKDRQFAKISWDIVDVPYHHKGVGTALWQHRLNIIKNKKDIKHIIVRTSQHAYQFYEKMGFKLLERHKDYWAFGFDMYKMIFNLKTN